MTFGSLVDTPRSPFHQGSLHFVYLTLRRSKRSSVYKHGETGSVFCTLLGLMHNRSKVSVCWPKHICGPSTRGNQALCQPRSSIAIRRVPFTAPSLVLHPFVYRTNDDLPTSQALSFVIMMKRILLSIVMMVKGDTPVYCIHHHKLQCTLL